MYNLLYDYSRCMGGKQGTSVHPTCEDCMRRISKGNLYRQPFVSATPDEDGKCSVKISVKRWNERLI